MFPSRLCGVLSPNCLSGIVTQAMLDGTQEGDGVVFPADQEGVASTSQTTRSIEEVAIASLVFLSTRNSAGECGLFLVNPQKSATY